jgi:hypothetical protein
VVEIGRVRTDQLHFKADQTARSPCVCSNCDQNYENTPYSVKSNCTREFNASVAIVHLSTKLQTACHSFSDLERSLLIRIRYCRSSLRPWRASVQKRFCKAANVGLMIVERREESLVGGQVPLGAPLQLAGK